MTALLYHPVFLKHDTGSGHPERPSRLEIILRKLKRTRLMDKLKIIESERASIEIIGLVHSKDYIFNVRDICSSLSDGYAYLDGDTPISKDSFEVALFAAGAVVKSIDLIFKGEICSSFCLVRPPGHHSNKSQGRGFCIFNNVAIGAKYLLENSSIKKVCIIDWDAHHGNGTEEIFYEDNKVFYISLHQYPHYPGTGEKEAIGRGEGLGYNLNIPMQPGSGDDEYIKAFSDIILPRLREYKPEFIFISAGFDSHRDDPLSSLNLTEDAYRKMTEYCKDIARRYSMGRIVSVLEGGYNLIALADSVKSHLQALIE